MAEKPAMILVVDDELDILRLTETVLRQAGHPVTAARSADAAIPSVGSPAVVCYRRRAGCRLPLVRRKTREHPQPHRLGAQRIRWPCAGLRCWPLCRARPVGRAPATGSAACHCPDG